MIEKIQGPKNPLFISPLLRGRCPERMRGTKGVCIWLLLFVFLASPVFAQAIWSGPTDRRVVALTFDDGPNFEGSTELLDILDKYGVKATFFVIGREADQNPDVIYRMSDYGHEVGNHTYSHARLGDLSKSDIEEGVKKTNLLISEITGEKPKCFRPPGGTTSAALSYDIEQMGMSVVCWTINAEDYTEYNENFEIEENYQKIADELKEKVLSEAKPGAIILLHNGSKQTLLALPGIIEGLRGFGYGFVTVSELLSKGDY
jgi:peptidoglycan/xylan/chitin deacetylase (PgdA/CDA1 family)